MNKRILALIIGLAFLITACTSDAGTAKLPKIKVTPTNIFFSDNGLFIDIESQPEVLEIKNIGEGDLVIDNIAFKKSSAGDVDYAIKEVHGKKLGNITYPITLKKDEIAKVKITMTPTEDGIKVATLQITSNITGNKVTEVEVGAQNFEGRIVVDEVMKTSSSYVTKTKDINTLSIKKCDDILDQETLFNICNSGKASLMIKDITFEASPIVLEYIKMEPINFPAKIPGSFDGTGKCITGVSICHNGDNGEELVMAISNDSSVPEKIIRITTKE